MGVPFGMPTKWGLASPFPNHSPMKWGAPNAISSKGQPTGTIQLSLVMHAPPLIHLLQNDGRGGCCHSCCLLMSMGELQAG